MKKRIKFIAILALMCVLILAFYINSPKIIVRKIYFDNTDEFSVISNYFKGLYQPKLSYAKLDIESPEVDLRYQSVDENKEKTYSSDKIENVDETVIATLSALKSKYQIHSKNPVFSSATAYYDPNGRILLYVCAMSKYNRNANEYRKYYIIYIDEGYSGAQAPFHFVIDNGKINAEPFSDNWYYRNADFPSG